MGGLAKGLALVVGLGVVAATVPSSAPAPAPRAVPATSGVATPSPTAQTDPRVSAFIQAYRDLIDSVTVRDGDVVFYLLGQPIHFEDGRMLEHGLGDDNAECDPIFYQYSLAPLTEPVAAAGEMPVYCTDVLETLWGSTEAEVRKHGRSIEFLDHRMFVNEILQAPLAAVERDLRHVARQDPSVAGWIDGLDITYSFIDRGIAGSPSRSYHAWGMAIDFVPSSYDGRHVYWRWSRVFDREGWDRIPMEQRWSPPPAVVATFERHGFVWGGKWAHFDVIHFEYRPEIILYNRLIAGSGS